MEVGQKTNARDENLYWWKVALTRVLLIGAVAVFAVPPPRPGSR